jgi:Yip1 domain
VGLVKRIEGVFFSPKSTFEGLAARPAWIDALIFVLAALITFNLIIAPFMMRDQLERDKNSPVLREKLGEELYQKRISALENPSRLSVAGQTIVYNVLSFILAMLLQALFLFVGARYFSTQGTYAQILSVLLHANVVDKFLGNAVRLTLVLSRQTLTQTSTGLAMLFPKLDSMSMPYIILNQIDLFQLWMFGILAVGLSAVFKVRFRKALALSYALWLLKAAVNIGLGLITSGFYR